MSEPSPPGDELLQQLSTYDLRVGELALGLRAIVLKEAPSACESIFRSYALALWYSFTGRMSESFCYIGVSSNHVNLGFSRGAELPDPDGVLEGSGKQMRHIKIRRPEDLERPHLRRFIRESIKQVRVREKEKKIATKSTTAKRRRGRTR